jgi:hypothetical protein
MLQAIVRTITELLDSKKAAYSFLATIFASVLHLYFGIDVQNALLLVSPLGVATLSQAHVDAAAAKNGTGATASTGSTGTTATVEGVPAPATDDAAKPSDGSAT